MGGEESDVELAESDAGESGLAKGLAASALAGATCAVIDPLGSANSAVPDPLADVTSAAPDPLAGVTAEAPECLPEPSRSGRRATAAVKEEAGCSTSRAIAPAARKAWRSRSAWACSRPRFSASGWPLNRRAAASSESRNSP